MSTRARGPVMADINRAIKAAQKQGWMEASIKFPNGCEIVLRKGAADPAAAPAKVVTPLIEAPAPNPIKPQLRLNPEWERICNDPERMKLVEEWSALCSQLWEMKRRAPPQPGGRATTMAQLRVTSSEFRRLDEERSKLSKRIGPDPERYLLDDGPADGAEEPKRPVARW